jgi:hypothetical protein
VRPLRPATDHCLGGPLPRQLANRPRPPLPAYCCFDPQEFHPRMLCGISPGFPELSPTRRQVSHVLLTRSPLYSRGCPRFLVRLACVRHAASVDSEPGSNSRLKPDALPARAGRPPLFSSEEPRAAYLVRSLELYSSISGSLLHACAHNRALQFLTTGTFNLLSKTELRSA